ncbi:MAG: hypothetical protein A3F83_09780 [Candidatus Glassbacteria bacterium RIFCSPLOWO2_12_FULL_58_11]|uniref:N-acetyltransferase domain-containing protein n=1 Tax=Candidatus Glassbacteria bacterium RIFCSPLOWO2_12_FULL_58_11 TaxID=1817867 RepID=A0A1F5YZG2_9BACT|nr:MAG: hypothetical protein A3F83_09780 [Candidatus Glassbacteria bacterium RIFCSPLOWO2_12_FULL_58_11]
MRIRKLRKNDFFLLNELDWTPLPKERDSIYLILAVDQGKCSFIAEQEGEFLGVVLATRGADGGSIYVNHLLVKGGSRQRGVGKSLMDRLEKYAAKEGARRIWLFCHAELEGYYESRGYCERYDFLTPELKKYIRTVKGVHAYLKEIQPARHSGDR